MGTLLAALIIGLFIGLGLKLFGWLLGRLIQIVVACVKGALIVVCVLSFVYFIILILPTS
jgi:hypothetical protein